jgi:hypothetical protein
MEQQLESKLYISSSIADNLPSMVRNELAKMSAQKQEEFVEEYKRKSKSLGFAYLFLVFVFSIHYGYLGKWGLQIVFWLTGGGFLVWWFIDLFRLPGLVKDYNKDIATDVMRNLKSVSN